MVLQASIFRASDGLPLCASTDVGQNPLVQGCQKYLKLMSRRIVRLPDRCTLHLEGFYIYLISALDLGFMVLCEESYPTVLSFSFLDEVQKEFLVTYDRDGVQSARRPYAFIEFETFLQKCKQRYNSPRSLTTRVDLSGMSTEIKLRPPHSLSAEDLGIIDNGLVLRPIKDTHRPTVSPGRRLVPLNWVGMLAIIINLFCAALNLTRGMSIIGHGHFDEEDSGAYTFGGTFLLAAVLSLYQIYLLFNYTRWQKLRTFFMLASLCWCNYYLQQFRNNLQIAFHLSAALFCTIVILNRQLTEKLLGYSV